MKKNSVVRKTYRSFVLMGILTALTTTLGMLIDNVIVGWSLGSVALGAMSIISPVSLILSAFGNICSGGGTARAARAMGRGSQAQVNGIFTVTMFFAVAAGALVTAAGLLFTPQIAGLLGAKGELLAPTVDYLRGYSLGALPTILTTALMGFVKIDGSSKLPLACIGVMTAVNIALDLILTYVFHMGMFGMALATSISYCCAALTGCTHFMKKHASLRLVRPERALNCLAGVVQTGAPTALSRICDTVKIMAINHALVAVAGAAAVTALNVRTQANNLLMAVTLGVAQAIVPVASVFYGEEDRRALKETFREALCLGLILCAGVAVLLILFAESFAGLLGVQEGEILAMSADGLRFLALTLPLLMVNVAMLSFCQSTGNNGFATMICILQSLVYATGFALVLVRPMQVRGVWLAFLLSELCTLLTSLARIALRSRRLPRSLDDLMALPADFGGSVQERLEYSIGCSMEDAAAAARGVYAFGERFGVGRQALDRLSLVIEEIAGNVVRHSISQKQGRGLDLLVLNREDALVVRFRDNGARFDPVAFLKNRTPEDDHIGIRIAFHMADQINYRYSIGLNSLQITIKKDASVRNA